MAVAIGGAERLIVAVDAASSAYMSVAVRTGEAGIDRELLHLEGETLAEPSTVVEIRYVFIHGYLLFNSSFRKRGV